ncbi:MAG: phosphodiester glycosidase family protein [Solobacterium sp.]|nr:phosphodiester glycosidase family protein [Solobacterium sp.]
MKTTVLIPAYCPDEKLLRFAEELSENGCTVLVVNDGSPAEYSMIFERLGCTVLSYTENRGKGHALKTGLRWLQENMEGPYITVTADADGQHKTEDVLKVRDEAAAHPGALVLGCRDFSGEDVPARSRIGNRLTAKVFRLFAGTALSDTQTGLRAWDDMLNGILLNIGGDRYEYEMNVLLECAQLKIPFREVRIQTVYEDNNSCSHFRALRDSLRIAGQLLTFASSSLACFVIDWLLFTVLTLLGANIAAANITARLVSASCNYTINQNTVFRNSGSPLRYAALAAAVLACNTAMLYLLTQGLHMNVLLAKIITEIVLFAVSYTAQKHFVFTSERNVMKKRFLYIPDALLIGAVTAYTLLDAFVIPKQYASVQAPGTAQQEQETAAVDLIEDEISVPAVTDTSYTDKNISVSVETYRYLDTTVYVADVEISDIRYLQSVFAEDSYGRNITDTVSSMAESSSAVLAVNGDYYGAREKGYVLRNGVLYRSSSSGAEDLVIHADGSFSIIDEDEVSAEELLESGALQVYSFGPALIIDSEIAVDADDEVGHAMSSNQRTAVCEISPLHYLFVVSDGRTDESEGLSLLEFAEFLSGLDVKTAYNLDGGGSSTMVFMGKVINNPTTNGNRIKERSVSDSVCIIS